MVTEKLDLLTTTNEFEDNMTLDGTKYSSKIRLRPESFQAVTSNVLNFPVRNADYGVDVSNTEEPLENGYQIISEFPEQVDQDAKSRAIRLKSEKMRNVIENLAIENVVKDKPEFETQDVEENQNFSEEVSSLDDTMQFEAVSQEVFQENESASSEIDEIYQQISQETKETLKIKEDALKAQKRIQEVEASIQQEVEESDQRLQEKSAEHAEIQSRKEEALKRKTEIDRTIADTFEKQRKSLKQAKENYLNIISKAETRENELRAEAMEKTKENESKIVQFQQSIDRDSSLITETEGEIAKKEAILKALSNPIELGLSNDSLSLGNTNTMENQEQQVYKRVA